MQAAENQGLDADQHFMGSHETPTSGGPARLEVKLTRFAAYLVAMNGDPAG